MSTRWIIGLACGSTASGVEATLVEIEGRGLTLRPRVVHFHSEPFPKDLHDLVVRASTPEKADVRQISLAHRLIGEGLARAGRQLADSAGISLHKVLCVGCSGFTAWHDGDGRLSSTLRLGASAVVAEKTGLTTIDDFAGRDLASGGQGLPLGVWADHLLLNSSDEHRLHIHLGGLVEASWLPANGDLHDWFGWQIGPGMTMLDSLTLVMGGGKVRADPRGTLAVQGRQIPELLQRWRNHPFMLKSPPKSTHRSAFAEEFARQTAAYAQQMNWSLYDLLCTANHFIAQAIADCVRGHTTERKPIQRILLSGIGVGNGLLWRLIQEQFPAVPMERTDGHGIPADAMEAAEAAILACLFLDGVSANLPHVTGAQGPRRCGSVTPGTPTNWARCLRVMLSAAKSDLQEEDD